MSKTLEAIHTLEDRLNTLLTNYEFLKEENDVLLHKVNVLQQHLIQGQQVLVDHQEQYDLLKMAKTINGSEENTRETKLKINALIREIDKCIVQLNE